MKGKLRKSDIPKTQQFRSVQRGNCACQYIECLLWVDGILSVFIPRSLHHVLSFRQAFSATENCSAYGKVNLLSTLPLACAVHTPRRHNFNGLGWISQVSRTIKCNSVLLVSLLIVSHSSPSGIQASVQSVCCTIPQPAINTNKSPKSRNP